MIAAASRGTVINLQNYKDLIYVGVGILVFVAFVFVARLIAHVTAEQLRKHNVRTDMVVLGRRVVTALVIVLGVFAALGIAAQTANVTLFGLLLATIVAALGVQDLLRDYVSGYYVLWEHHIRVGDHIAFDGHEGVITEVKLRVTILKSDNGDVMVVPNSELFTKPVIIHGVTPAQEEARKAPPT